MNTKNILLGILIVVVFLAGFIIGRFSVTSVVLAPTTLDNQTAQEEATASGGSTTTSDVVVEGESIASQMTEGQKQLLRTFGLDPEKITITAEMVACAEAKVGVARMEEIKNGATPSFTEGASLFACYK
jgi:hypothetical protein